jgi:serine/threonine protein kinase
MNEPPVNAIVMELIEGGSLAKWVGRSGLLASAYRRNTITYSEYVGVQQYVQREITRALQHLHDQGLAHMDLKPDNVMFTAHFRVKIIDLGSLTPQSGTNKNPPVTGKWRSPEYLSPPTGATQSDAVNTSYDMYGSGLMANEGIEPVFGATNYGTEGKLGKEAHEGTRKDTAATQFVKKVTEQDPGKRATAAEALDLPYLSESLLNDDQARAVLKFVSERQANPKAVKPASRRDEPAPPGPEQRSRFDEVLQELRQAEVFLVKAANAEADSVA